MIDDKHAKWLARGLRTSLELLAAPADAQIAWLKKIGTYPSADELALDYDNFAHAAANLVDRGELSRDLFEALIALDGRFEEINGVSGEWTPAALETGSIWASIRTEAQRLVGLLPADFGRDGAESPHQIVSGERGHPMSSIRLLLGHPVAWLVGVSFVLALAYGLVQQAIWEAGGLMWLGAALKVSGIVVLAALAALGRANVLVVYALIFGGAGDWLLAQHSTSSFAGGALAFAFGHFCYIRAFLREGADIGGALRTPVRLAAMLAVTAGAIAGVIWLIPFESAWFIGLSLYTAVLTLMVLFALALPASRWLAIVGAVLFLISDGFVAAEVFYPQPDQAGVWFWRTFVGWMLYWAAQTALCVGMMNLSRAIATPGASR